MDINLKKKLVEEQVLSVDEALALDDALEVQSVARTVVSRLVDEEPSLAWRSSLNERLVNESGTKGNKKAWRWGYGVFATAAAVATFVALYPREISIQSDRTVRAQPASVNIEESLVSAHKEAELESGLGVAWSQAPMDSKSDSL